MDIFKNYSLQTLNTFGFDVEAKNYAAFNSKKELLYLLHATKNDPHLILGGGSNILFTQNYNGWVLKNNIKGVNIISENNDFVFLNVGAGEVWHNFVLNAIQNNWGGIENLSLIPGVVGAAPIQNIGAYGVEQKDVFIELEALNKETLQTEVITHKDCKFGYRNSIFKNKSKDQYVILNVTYKLAKQPIINISYGIISAILKEKNSLTPTIRDISNIIISIREAKLPNPKEIGNAGSFFKNPIISENEFNTLLKKNSEVPNYKLENGEYKIPAGWLIEQCGFKGKEYGNVGVHKNQALVLVNYGKGYGHEIYQLSETIINSVFEKYSIKLEREVNII